MNGTNSARIGVWLPTIAPSVSLSMPVVSPSVTIGTAIEPNATGAVLPISASVAALTGLKPRPTSTTRRDRHGRAEAGQALDQRAERERDHDRLHALVVASRPNVRRSTAKCPVASVRL